MADVKPWRGICRDCKETKPIGEFVMLRGKPTSLCRKCNNDKLRASRASRRGGPAKAWRHWSDDEMTLLLDENLRTGEIARRVGRSPASVASKRHLLLKELSK